MIHDGAIVKFRKVKNARGYPLTGRISCSDAHFAIVEAWGLYGPGTTTDINEVPLADLEEIDVTESDKPRTKKGMSQ